MQRQVENERNIAAGNPGDVDFIGLVRSWRKEHSHTARPMALAGSIINNNEPPASDGPPRICVAVRKRPVSDKERERSDHDSVTVLHPKVWIHAAKLKVDGIQKYLDHSSFEFDYAFDEYAETLDVYKLTTLPLLQYVVNDSGRATVFCYGQTGSGKTYTMQGIQALLAEDMFALIAKDNRVNVSVSMYELYGGFLQDLLNNRKRLKVLEDGKGEINVTGLTERETSSVEEFHSILDAGNAARTTHATQANDSSSRSHAICTILLRSSAPKAAEGKRGDSSKLLGKLSLVDLAGSERGNDTTSHNAQRRTESADINTSLLALKECIRAMGSCDIDPHGSKKPHIPYRQSKLTLILKDCLASADARTAMIATVSPGASSADHSVNTLRYADRVKERPAHTTRQHRSKSPPNPRSATARAAPAAANLVRPVDRLVSSHKAQQSSSSSQRPQPAAATKLPESHASRENGPVRPTSSKPSSPSESPFETLISKPSASDESLLLIDSVGSASESDEKSPVARTQDFNYCHGGSDEALEMRKAKKKSPSTVLPDKEDDAVLKLSAEDNERFEDDGDEDDRQWLKREEEDVLNLHMGYIHENADLLSREGEMLRAVQLDNVDLEDIQEYAITLARVLDRKEDMILAMQNRIDEFQTQLLNRQTRVKGRLPRSPGEAPPPSASVDTSSDVRFL